MLRRKYTNFVLIPYIILLLLLQILHASGKVQSVKYDYKIKKFGKSPATGPSIILHNANVITMEEEGSNAQAVAIEGNLILDVGTDEEILALKTSATQLYDLEGRTVVPGLIEAHSHRLLHSFWDDGPEGFTFQMNKCRVQSARKRKGLADYPCKSGGLVEFTYFARTIDPRIRTVCVACPPDEHPDEWYCAWRFILAERSASLRVA